MSAAAASPALNPRAISKRLTEIRKNAINSRIVHGDFRIPCSNSQPGKNKKGVKAKKGTEVATEPGDEVESDSKVWRIIPPWLLVTADSLFLPYQKAVIPASDTSYLTPPATIKTESRTGWLIPTSKRSQGRKRTRCEQNTQKYHGNGNGEGKGNRYDSYQESDFNSDSDSDSLADLQDTPSKSVVANKKQRTLPARRPGELGNLTRPKTKRTWTWGWTISTARTNSTRSKFDKMKRRGRRESCVGVAILSKTMTEKSSFEENTYLNLTIPSLNCLSLAPQCR